MLPTAARGHAFLYKYRPRVPGGLRLQQPGTGKPNRGCRLGQARAAGEGQRGHVVAGGAGAGAATRRGRALTTGPTDPRTPRAAGRKRAKVTSPRVLRRLAFSCPLFLF